MKKGVHFCAPEQVEVDGPLIFLAGPIQGAADWQSLAKKVLRNLAPSLNVASPRRATKLKKKFTQRDYEEQVDWELKYLDEAAKKNGVILFWLARENEHFCDRAFAQTTRVEFGDSLRLHNLGLARIVVGIEEGYSGARYARHVIAHRASGIAIFSDLPATCRGAVSEIKSI